MRAVKAKNNLSTEKRLLSIMRSRGIVGWRRNYPVKGKPDFVFLDRRVAVFVDGCFWHGHDCRNLKPKSNTDYWDKKINKNRDRDQRITNRFQMRGWRVVRIWECELKHGDIVELERVLK